MWVLCLTFGFAFNWCGPVCGARKNHRAYAFPRFFRPRHSKCLHRICHRQRSPFLGEQCLFGIVGWPCCGARCAPRPRRAVVAHRPLPLARLPSSATGSGRLAPPTSYARRTHNRDGSCEACCHNQKETPSGWMGFLFGCGGRTRTYDLRVMSPTSFQLLYSAILIFFVQIQPEPGSPGYEPDEHPFAVPEKIIRLAHPLDFFDRCTHCAPASSATGSAWARDQLLYSAIWVAPQCQVSIA